MARRRRGRGFTSRVGAAGNVLTTPTSDCRRAALTPNRGDGDGRSSEAGQQAGVARNAVQGEACRSRLQVSSSMGVAAPDLIHVELVLGRPRPGNARVKVFRERLRASAASKEEESSHGCAGRAPATVRQARRWLRRGSRPPACHTRAHRCVLDHCQAHRPDSDVGRHGQQEEDQATLRARSDSQRDRNTAIGNAALTGSSRVGSSSSAARQGAQGACAVGTSPFCGRAGADAGARAGGTRQAVQSLTMSRQGLCLASTRGGSASPSYGSEPARAPLGIPLGSAGWLVVRWHSSPSECAAVPSPRSQRPRWLPWCRGPSASQSMLFRPTTACPASAGQCAVPGPLPTRRRSWAGRGGVALQLRQLLAVAAFRKALESEVWIGEAMGQIGLRAYLRVVVMDPRPLGEAAASWCATGANGASGAELKADHSLL